MKVKSLAVLEGAALLVGTIFGAGFLVLPYTALRAGIWLSLGWLALFAVVATLLHLMYGEIVLATNDDHRLPGYAKLYLGRLGQALATVTFVAGVFGGLLVYLLLGSRLLQEIFKLADGTSPAFATIVFWLVMTFLILAGIRLSSGLNFLVTIVTMTILFGLSVFSLTFFLDLSNFSLQASAPPLFPYGIILFSVVGYLAIPEITAFLGGRRAARDLLRPIIIAATLFSAVFSGLFMIAIFGTSGASTSQDAISGLTGIFPQWAVLLALLLAFLEIATSYLIFGLSIHETLSRDFKMRKNLSGALVAFLPISLFFFGLKDFVSLIGFLGAIWISVDAILISLIWRKVRALEANSARLLSLPPWSAFLLAILFAIGGLTALFFGH